MKMKKAMLQLAWGAVIGAALIILYGTSNPIEMTWDASLFGSGISLLSLGLIFWAKIKSR